MDGKVAQVKIMEFQRLRSLQRNQLINQLLMPHNLQLLEILLVMMVVRNQRKRQKLKAHLRKN